MLLTVLGIVCGSILLIFALFIVPLVSYKRARRKGYRPPGAVLITLLGFAVGIGLTILWNSVTSTTNVLITFLYFADLPLLLSTLAIAVVILVLPRRKLRVFGARQVKFPFVRLGQGVIALGIVLVALATFGYWSKGTDFGDAMRTLLFVPVPIAIGQYLIRRGRNLKKALSLDERLSQDRRPPVLYLRAFSQEGQLFIFGPDSTYGSYVKNKSILTMLSKARAEGGSMVYATLEQYLCAALENSIGPFVALGSPEDYLAPEGAVRLYAKDDDWMDQLDQLARRSTCILVEMGTSDNLRWEFEHLRREGLQEKLFIVTRVTTQATPRELSNFKRKVATLAGHSPCATGWREFSDVLTTMGYVLGCDDPGPGSVITFDAEGRGILLTTQADLPADFVGPIRAWLADRGKIGRYVPASPCTMCGRKLYVFPGHAEIAVDQRCVVCRQKLETEANRKATLRVTLRVVLGIPLLFIAYVVVDQLLIPLLPQGLWIRRHSWNVFIVAAIAFYFVRWFRKRQVSTRMDTLAGSHVPKEAGDPPPINGTGRKGVRVVSIVHFVLAFILVASSPITGDTRIEHELAAVDASLALFLVLAGIALWNLSRRARKFSIVFNASLFFMAIVLSLVDLRSRNFLDSAFVLVLGSFSCWIVWYLRRSKVRLAFGVSVATNGAKWYAKTANNSSDCVQNLGRSERGLDKKLSRPRGITVLSIGQLFLATVWLGLAVMPGDSTSKFPNMMTVLFVIVGALFAWIGTALWGLKPWARWLSIAIYSSAVLTGILLSFALVVDHNFFGSGVALMVTLLSGWSLRYFFRVEVKNAFKRFHEVSRRTQPS